MLLRERPLMLFVLVRLAATIGNTRSSPFMGNVFVFQFVFPSRLVPQLASTSPAQTSVAGTVRSSRMSNFRRARWFVIGAQRPGCEFGMAQVLRIGPLCCEYVSLRPIHWAD